MTSKDTYLSALTSVEAARAAFNQLNTVSRTWPSTHPFEELPGEIEGNLHDAAVRLGRAQDALVVAWRAYKKELR